MYLIRVDESRTLLRVECSGRMRTVEALRAVSQVAALAEAGEIWALLVTVDDAARGPAARDLLAAALAANRRDGLRVAFVVAASAQRYISRLVRGFEAAGNIRLFETEDEARRWLTTAQARTAPAAQKDAAEPTPALAAPARARGAA
jgi:N-acetylglutamate synthase-like GNAT family acetyltransferase